MPLRSPCDGQAPTQAPIGITACSRITRLIPRSGTFFRHERQPQNLRLTWWMLPEGFGKHLAILLAAAAKRERIMRTGILMTAAVLAGCAPFWEPVKPAFQLPSVPPSPPKQEMVWFKQGATSEEFQRTKAVCLQSQVDTMDANPNGFGWTMAFSLCMRANGWVLVRNAKGGRLWSF